MGNSHANLWTIDPREVLRPAPGFDLTSFDRRGTPGFAGDKAAGKALTDARGGLLNQLQERLYAEGRAGGTRSVLVIVQGLDTAGKGGIARHVMGYVDPQGVQLRSFGVPTEEERSNHYLWRIRNALPSPGRIGVFDRSHYEDVLVVRVDELVPQSEWEPRYDEINEFERELVDAGTVVLKFAMMVSHEQQGLRLMERLDRPDKHWKYSMSDLTTRRKWDDYQAAYQAVIDRTNTDHAPWYVLPADRKWFPRLAVTEILARSLIEMDLRWPSVEWSDDDQRSALADSMTTASLAESLAETEPTVQSAIEETLAVAAAAAELVGADLAVVEEKIEASRAGMLAEMAQNIAHKRELLTARPDWEAPEPKQRSTKDEEKSKGKKKSKKSKKKK